MIYQIYDDTFTMYQSFGITKQCKRWQLSKRQKSLTIPVDAQYDLVIWSHWGQLQLTSFWLVSSLTFQEHLTHPTRYYLKRIHIMSPRPDKITEIIFLRLRLGHIHGIPKVFIDCDHFITQNFQLTGMQIEFPFSHVIRFRCFLMI